MKLEKFISIHWYLQRKPYKIHTGYDIFYLKICRRLFSMIEEMVSKYEDEVNLDEEGCRDLAYKFTACFEDQVNGFGFWQSLVQLHKKHFGKRLPFFDKKTLQQQAEEWEDILPADIHYLAYISYLNYISYEDEKELVNFDKKFFIALSEKVVDYLGNIEEVLTTDFYKNYLIPGDDYIDFKIRLAWFTFESYLTGIEFSEKIDNHLLEMMEEKIDQSMLAPLQYAERDRLMFEEPTSFTAFFPIDILAGAMQCPETKKEEIRQLKFRPRGIFHVQKQNDTHYFFVHTATGEEFNVVKKNFTQPLDVNKADNWITTLAKWNNEYSVSGLCSGYTDTAENISYENFEYQHLYQQHYAPYRKKIEQTALDFSTAAVKFFGHDLIVYETGRQLQKKLAEFSQWYFDIVTDKSKLSPGTKPVVFELPAKLLIEKDITLYIPALNGMQFITRHKQHLNLLQTKNWDMVDIDDIEDMLAMVWDKTANVEYWVYLRKNFSLPNLSKLLNWSMEADEDFDALLRIYRPHEFSPLKLPSFKIFSSDPISAEKAKDMIAEMRK